MDWQGLWLRKAALRHPGMRAKEIGEGVRKLLKVGLAAFLVVFGCVTDSKEGGVGNGAKAGELRVYMGLSYSLQCSEGFGVNDEVTLHLNYPQGGETFRIGDTVVISLCMEDATGEDMSGATLELFQNNLPSLIQDFQVIEGPLKENLEQGKFVWEIPGSLDGFDGLGNPAKIPVECEDCQIRLLAYSNDGSETNFDMSPAFQIKKREISGHNP